ncbi:MAG: methyltransferase domain-containing protein [Candidatus Obscuribacterales bacterium]|jgi:methyl halide transferase|nr:methyltransferase domain-containing protein [Candidatus Obscuribacterales bacterium]
MEQTRQHTVEDREFWENLYQTKRTAWDLGQVAPPLKTLMNSPYAMPKGRMAVLGCGNGHECLFFAERGFEVTGVDFAPSAIRSTMDKLSKSGLLGKSAYLLERDFFKMHDYDGYYDYVLEHCSFCAIDPSLRRTYAWTVRDLLKPQGKFISLWWLIPDKQGGPPFAAHKTDLFDLFGEFFNIEIAYEPKDSVKDRKGHEFITVMSRK